MAARNEDLVNEHFAIARSLAEECIQEDELRALLATKEHPICYDGFEPSGRMHIAQGLLKALNVNKLTGIGCKFIFWVADWFAFMNNKMGGDLDKIKIVGKYMIEVWKAVGMDMEHVEFKWSSDEINKNPNEYWMRVMDIAQANTISRIKRCATIMGRKESDEMSAAQIMYPCMQCADIFFLKVDICQLGMDQRKVNMLVREYCDTKKNASSNEVRTLRKPIILSHHMLMGLQQGQEKMSKSDPASAIFMEDSEEEVNKKIKKAHCAPGNIDNNPVLEYARYIIFPKYGSITIANRPYNSSTKLEAAFIANEIHPKDLKMAVAAAINFAIEPVRQHFKNNKEANDLLQQVREFRN